MLGVQHWSWIATHTHTHTHTQRQRNIFLVEGTWEWYQKFFKDWFLLYKINNTTLQNCNSNALALLITKLGCKISALKRKPRFYHLRFGIWDLKVEIWCFEDVVMLGVGSRVMVIVVNNVALLHCLVVAILSLFCKHKLGLQQ